MTSSESFLARANAKGSTPRPSNLDIFEGSPLEVSSGGHRSILNPISPPLFTPVTNNLQSPSSMEMLDQEESMNSSLTERDADVEAFTPHHKDRHVFDLEFAAAVKLFCLRSIYLRGPKSSTVKVCDLFVCDNALAIVQPGGRQTSFVADCDPAEAFFKHNVEGAPLVMIGFDMVARIEFDEDETRDTQWLELGVRLVDGTLAVNILLNRVATISFDSSNVAAFETSFPALTPHAIAVVPKSGSKSPLSDKRLATSGATTYEAQIPAIAVALRIAVARDEYISKLRQMLA